MIENYKSIRPGVPDGCSEKGVQLPKNTLTNKFKHLIKLSSNFSNLMKNEDGQILFEEFAKQIKIYDYVLFWFAVEGFKKTYQELELDLSENKITSKNFETEIVFMEKAIYNNFMKNNDKSRVYNWFSNQTKKNIYEKISRNSLDIKIFKTAQNEFEDKIQEKIYPQFLKSNIYLKYVSNLENKNFNKDSNNKKINLAKNYNSLIKIDKNTCKNRLSENKNMEAIKENKLNNLVLSKNDSKNEESNNLKSKPSSHLPNKPELDYEKVQVFVSKLEMVERDRNEQSNQRILSVLQKFEQNEEINSLKNLIKSKIISEDSQTILDQHCSRVFISNETTISHNSNCDTPKKNYKLNQLKPLSNLNKINSPNFNNMIALNSSYNSNQTVIMYQYEDEIPYSIKLNVFAITLRQFKQEIIKKTIDPTRQKYRYFFKKKDPLENMYIMEELTNDNDYVPYCDGKIFSKIEIVSI